MSYKFIYLIMFFATTTLLFPQIKQIYTIHTKKKSQFSDFAVITDSKTDRKFLMFIAAARDDKEILYVYDNKDSLLLEIKFSKFITFIPFNSGSDKYIMLKDKFYFIGDEYLFKLNIHTVSIDSIKLPVDKYSDIKGKKRLYYYNLNNDEYLIYDYGNGVDLYKLNPFILFKEFEKNFTDKGYGGIPILLKKRIIYTNKKNELICKNLESKKTIWTYNSGETDMSFLGITVGSVADYIPDYSFINGKHGELFFSTSNGDLINVDVNTGKEKIRINKFGGDDHRNFAGKLTYIVQYDMNKDSTTDFVSISADRNLYVINGKDMSVLWHKKFDSRLYNPFSLYDINNDNIPEVFIYIDSYLYILNGKDGNVIYTLKISDENFYGSRIILGDFNNNGKLNIILNSAFNEIKILEMENVNIPKGMMIINK